MWPPSWPLPILSPAVPRSINLLADATHTHGASMARLLRALTSLGIFGEDTTGRYRQTALSDTLRCDYSDSIRPAAMMLGAHFVGKRSGMLEETGSDRASMVRTPIRRRILRIPGRASGRRCCLQLRDEYLARPRGCHRWRVSLPSKGPRLHDAQQHRQGFCRRHRSSAQQTYDHQAWAVRGFMSSSEFLKEMRALLTPGD